MHHCAELQLVLVDALEFELEKSSIVELRYRNEDVGTNTDAVGSKLKFELFIFFLKIKVVVSFRVYIFVVFRSGTGDQSYIINVFHESTQQ